MARTANISFRADISNLRKQLQEIPGVTEAEAKRMVSALQKQMKEAEKAAKKAATATRKGWDKAKGSLDDVADSTKNATDKLQKMEDVAGETDSVLAGMAGALELVSPELADAVRTAGDLSGGFEAVTRTGVGLVGILGPVAVAVGAAALAYQHFAGKVAEAEEKMKLAREEAEKLAAAVGAIKQERITAELAKQVALGEEQAEVLAARNAQLRAESVYQDLRTDSLGKVTQAQAKLIEAEQTLSKLKEKGPTYVGYTEDEAEAKQAVTSATRLLRAEKAKLAGLDGQIAGLAADYLETWAAGQKKGESASKGRVKAGQDEAAVLVDLAEAEAARAKAAEQGINMARSTAEADLLSDAERLILARDEELARIRSLAVATGDRAAASEAMLAVEARAERDLAKLRQDNLDAYNKAREQAHKDELGRIRDQASALASGASQFFGGLVSLSEWAAEKQNEASAEAAERWFAFYKATAITQAIIDGAVAAVKAVAQLGPIAGGIAAAGIAGLTAAQIGVIASQDLPSYHVGGMNLAPDEGLSKVRHGEGYVTERGVRAAGGQAGLAALNRGESAGSTGPVVVIHKYKHRVYGRFVQDSYKLPGSPYRSHIKGGSRVGHRAA